LPLLLLSTIFTAISITYAVVHLPHTSVPSYVNMVFDAIIFIL
jgi:hypothetical protein